MSFRLVLNARILVKTCLTLAVLLVASRASAPSFGVNVQRCPCIQIYSLIYRMALHLTLALCI